MKFKIPVIFVIAVISTVLSHSASAQRTITGFQAPESVITSGGKIFVSNIGGTQPNPMALDSNGFISELAADGKIIEKKFNKTILNGPKGLAIIGSTLYTADINRVVGFNINSGAKVFELSFPDAKMLNDLCTVDDKHLVVSESVGGNIYLINVTAKSFDMIGNIGGANGVTYDAVTKKLYACGMGMNMDGSGKLYVKDMSSKGAAFTELPDSPTGVFDGLEMIDNDHLLVTDWHGADSTKGRFVIYNLKDNSIKTYAVDAGPADVHYNKASHTFYLPQMIKNSLLIEDLNKLKQD
jgi:hypothetical protein